jgi:peptidoglycan hydrolase-like protein with peptidoglycan-binding domain
VTVDGIFGPKTATAVRGFQQALGITVDGIVGPLTWRALVSGMLSF